MNFLGTNQASTNYSEPIRYGFIITVIVVIIIIFAIIYYYRKTVSEPDYIFKTEQYTQTNVKSDRTDMLTATEAGKYLTNNFSLSFFINMDNNGQSIMNDLPIVELVGFGNFSFAPSTNKLNLKIYEYEYTNYDYKILFTSPTTVLSGETKTKLLDPFSDLAKFIIASQNTLRNKGYVLTTLDPQIGLIKIDEPQSNELLLSRTALLQDKIIDINNNFGLIGKTLVIYTGSIEGYGDTFIPIAYFNNITPTLNEFKILLIPPPSKVITTSINIPDFTVNNWVQITIVVEGATIKIYRNGAFVSSTLLTNLTASKPSNIQYIKQLSLPFTVSFLHVYSRPIDAIEVINDYKSMIPEGSTIPSVYSLTPTVKYDEIITTLRQMFTAIGITPPSPSDELRLGPVQYINYEYA